MRTVKAIRLFYLIYTVYTFFMLAVSDYKLSHALIGLLMIWLTYFFFSLGCKTVHTDDLDTVLAEIFGQEEESRFPLASIASWPRWKYVFSAGAAWVCAVLCARFYTGKGFMAVIRNLLGGSSAYNDYQQFIQNNNITQLTLSKIPYVLMLAYLTIIMTWSVTGLVLGEERIRFPRIVYIVCVVGAYAYFGAARGTNFETYIIFIIFAYCMIQKVRSILIPKNFKYLLIAFLAGVALIIIYRIRIMNRGIEFINYICPEIHYNPDSILGQVFPTLVNIGVSLFSYLGYGIYCIGVTVKELCLGAPLNNLAMWIPSGGQLLAGESFGAMLVKTVDLEARWIPDFVYLLDGLGIVFYLVLFFILGRFTQKIENSNLPRQLIHVFEVLVFIEMLSIPVGNFLMSSSSNKIMVFYAFVWYLCCRLGLDQKRRIS